MSGAPPLLTVEGRFWRSIRADRLAHVLDPPAPDSAGRYHRPGQATLYLTAEADWAVIAVARYALVDREPRLIVPLRLSPARVVDQRDAAAAAAWDIDPALSAVRWQIALEAGDEPPSWHNADAARAGGADGIVDPSRGILDGWHMALFRWNVPGAPTVALAGDPLMIDYAAARARWAAPPGWLEQQGDLIY